MLAFMVLGLAAAVASETLSVLVGDGGLVYTPNNLKAAKGDKIMFEFFGGAHTVSQSGGVDAPCVQLEGGFDSGFVSENYWILTIEDDTRPIWFYCKQANHCQQGMAGVINAPSNDLINTYITNAKAFTAVQEPAQLSLQGVGASSDKAPGPLPRLEGIGAPLETIPLPGAPSPSRSVSQDGASASPPISVVSNRSSSPTSTWLTGSASTTSISPTSAPGSASGSQAKTRIIIAIVALAAALALAASAVLFLLRRRRRRLHRDGVAPYAISASLSAAQAPVALKSDLFSRTVVESEAEPTTMSELREMHSEMQRAGISVHALLSSLRAPRYDALSDGSLPGYAP